MRRVGGSLLVAAALLALAAGAWMPAARALYSDRPPLAHTGGFDEASCHACHFDQPLDSPDAFARLAGLPARLEPGAVHRLRVVVGREGLGAGGFQLSARYAEGERAGTQAGVLRALDARTEVTTAAATGVQYLHHTKAGTVPLASDTTWWEIEWTAPAEPASGSVVFHLAANAANGDQSEFGDLIRLRSDTLRLAPAPARHR